MSRSLGLALFAIALVGLALPAGPAAAQQNTCHYAFDGECDEPKICSSGSDAWDCRGEGLPGPNDCFWAYDGACDEPQYCPSNSDSWDCRRQGAAPGPESCPYSDDGECDEPQGSGYCLPGTDTLDCSGRSSMAGNSCEWAYDGECDEPAGTGVCSAGTDAADCRGEYGGVFFGEDDRLFADATAFPWSAIGKLMFESGGYCTASVIGRRTLLTAASCLFVDGSSYRIDAPSTFLAGLDGHTSVASARVVEHFLAPGYDNIAYTEGSSIDGRDWAFLTVDRDIADETGMFGVMDLSTADLRSAVRGQWHAVIQAGYSADKDSWLTANINCPIIEVFDDNTVFHECDTLSGDGGSPLFVERDGQYWIIGVDTATYPDTEGPYPLRNMAVDARAFATEYRRRIRR